MKFACIAVLLVTTQAMAGIDIGAEQDRCKSISKAWVQLLDQSQFDQSWKESANFFQSHVKKSEWKSDAQSIRLPVGKEESRKLKDVDYTQDVPELPKGDYILVQFWTDFSKKKHVIENVSLFHEDGEWKVIGYFIK